MGRTKIYAPISGSLQEIAVVYSLRAMESEAEDRRGALRFPMALELQFREVGVGPYLAQGAGQTVDLSSDAIFFTPSCALAPGTRLEVSVQWPVRLEGKVPLKFVVRGVVMGYRRPHAVLAIQHYEFRTLRASSEAAEPNAEPLPT